MAKKTTYEVVAIYDGKLDAADVFANLIYEKYQNNIQYQSNEDRKDVIAEGGETAYNTDEVLVIEPASGICA